MKKFPTTIPANITSVISRRKFLKSAAGGTAMLAATNTIDANTSTPKKIDIPGKKNPFEEILSRCGSEFGDIRECN